jgi:hypothetical protein
LDIEDKLIRLDEGDIGALGAVVDLAVERLDAAIAAADVAYQEIVVARMECLECAEGDTP